jgi:hypothetical protein
MSRSLFSFRPASTAAEWPHNVTWVKPPQQLRGLRSLAAGGDRLGQPPRWQTALLGSPPVAGLAADAQQRARGDCADAGLQEPSVLGLEISCRSRPRRCVATRRRTHPSRWCQLSGAVDIGEIRPTMSRAGQR